MISGASDEELDIAIARANVLLELQHKIDELKKENQELKKQLSNSRQIKNQQKEFIEYLEKEIVDSKDGSGQQYFAQQHLRLYKEIIRGKDE